MPKAFKWSATALVLVVLVGVVSHGVVVPRFLWESKLKSLASQFPNQTIDVQRVVLALSLNPTLMVSGLSVQHPAQQESLDIGLLRLDFHGIESIRLGRLQLQHLGFKGIRSQAQHENDCLSTPLSCLPRLPFMMVAQVVQAQMAPRSVEIEQAEFRVENPATQQILLGRIDHASHALHHRNQPDGFSLGWRLQVQAPGVNNAITVAIKAAPKGSSLFNDIQVQLDGQWGGFPWTGSLEQDQLALELAQAGGQGAPIIKLKGKNLRAYLRRDDAPETHQAAFSARLLEGGLPAQPWRMQQAEWTYTHEDAQAWTFNLAYEPATQRLEIQPARITGSEGLPADAQTRLLNCEQATLPAVNNKPLWAWQNGWFRVYKEAPKGTAALVLCPVAPPT
ncbi:MAG TPA: hypothetical protein VFV43_03560 [Limnobacter sp.]|nr:hypothetical protein [Limnobacter sp.]